MTKRLFAVAALFIALTGLSAQSFAQSNQTHRIDHRERHQQKRISDGLKDGSINANEAAHLESREAKIDRDEAAAKADGVVTRQEREKLNRELNSTSRDINRDRRRTPGVDRREEHQQDRISNGLKDGSLTAGEAARLEREETKINRDEAAAKADGVVTAKENARLNRELNHSSRDIHRARTNRNRQH